MQVISGNVNKPASYSHAMNTGGIHQDEQIKSLQKQIENVQKQLQSLSDNKNMSLEEKMEKRKELQQQIQDLNKQISQRKMEIQQEKQKAAQANNQDNKASEQRRDIKNADFNLDNGAIQGVISADLSMKQINVLQSTKSNMSREVKVLSNEIKVDKGRGGVSENKVAKLAKLNKQLDETSTKITDQISDMNSKLEKDMKIKQAEDKGKLNNDADLDNHKLVYNKAGEVSQKHTDGNISLLV
jgi:chromosome segregation ATPase